MAKASDDRRETRGPRGAAVLRVIYGAGLVALGACLGIVIGSLSETPRLVLERLRGPVETVDVAVPEQEKTRSEAAGTLERFSDLQEGRAPKSPRVSPSETKPPAEAEPPPELVPAKELEPAPSVAAAPPAQKKPEIAAVPESKPGSATPSAPVAKAEPTPAQGSVVQVASYVERKPADDLVKKLESTGFDAYVSQPAAANGRYRVRIRPASGESASELATRLRGFGFDTWATSE